MVIPTKKRSRGNGEGSVYQVKSGPNMGKWIAATPPINGKRKTKTAPTRDEANRHLVTMMSDIHKGKPLLTDKQNVKQFLTQWLDNVENTVKRLTFISYRMTVNRWAIPYIGTKRLTEFRREDAQRYIKQISDKGISASTVGKIRRVIKAAFQSAVVNDLVLSNPFNSVKPPRVVEYEIVPFTPAEVDVFLRAVGGHRAEALFFVAAILGMRSGEILGLRWRDVNLDAGTISVRYSLTRFGGGWELMPPKTPKSRRTIQIPPVLVRKLREHLDRQRIEQKETGHLWTNHSLVFPNLTGGAMLHNVLSEQYHNILTKAELPRKRFHDLRHTAASVMIEDDVPIKLVSEILGHSSIQITLRIYAHLYDTKREIAVAKMEARYKDF